MVVCAALAGLAGGCAAGPGVSWGNADHSEERRAEAACRAEAGAGTAGASAAYHACMAEFRRPERED